MNRYKERTYFGRHTCVTCHDTETVRHEKSIPTSVQSQSDKTISSLAASPLIGISPPYSWTWGEHDTSDLHRVGGCSQLRCPSFRRHHPPWLSGIRKFTLAPSAPVSSGHLYTGHIELAVCESTLSGVVNEMYGNIISSLLCLVLFYSPDNYITITVQTQTFRSWLFDLKIASCQEWKIRYKKQYKEHYITYITSISIP